MLRSCFNRYLTAMFCCVTLFGASVSHADQVVVYSARIEQLIKPMFDAFTKDTGIAVKFVTDKEGALLARLKAEGKNTPADMLITSDAGNLWEAAREGLLKPIKSETLETNIPAHLRDPRISGLVCRYVPAPLFTIHKKSNPLIFRLTKHWLTPNGKDVCACALPRKYTTSRWLR